MSYLIVKWNRSQQALFSVLTLRSAQPTCIYSIGSYRNRGLRQRRRSVKPAMRARQPGHAPRLEAKL
jgi:hypothetical protein